MLFLFLYIPTWRWPWLVFSIFLKTMRLPPRSTASSPMISPVPSTLTTTPHSSSCWDITTRFLVATGALVVSLLVTCCWFLYSRSRKEKLFGKILPPKHQESVRVTRILDTIKRRHRDRVSKINNLTSHLEVMVLDDPTHLQAFHYREWKIILSTALLNRFSTDDEIATIIAREVCFILYFSHLKKYIHTIWLFQYFN